MMNSGAEEHYVKIIIPLEQDEDGYPPAGSERLWAVQVGEGLFRVANIPFFTRGIGLGDIVSAVPEEQADKGGCASGRSSSPRGTARFVSSSTTSPRRLPCAPCSNRWGAPPSAATCRAW